MPLVALLTSLFLGTACLKTAHYVGNTRAAASCHAGCRDAYEKWSDHVECFSQCPDVTLVDGACLDLQDTESTPKKQVCEEINEADGTKTVTTLAVVAGVLLAGFLLFGISFSGVHG